MHLYTCIHMCTLKHEAQSFASLPALPSLVSCSPAEMHTGVCMYHICVLLSEAREVRMARQTERGRERHHERKRPFLWSPAERATLQGKQASKQPAGDTPLFKATGLRFLALQGKPWRSTSNADALPRRRADCWAEELRHNLASGVLGYPFFGMSALI